MVVPPKAPSADGVYTVPPVGAVADVPDGLATTILPVPLPLVQLTVMPEEVLLEVVTAEAEVGAVITVVVNGLTVLYIGPPEQLV